MYHEREGDDKERERDKERGREREEGVCGLRQTDLFPQLTLNLPLSRKSCTGFVG